MNKREYERERVLIKECVNKSVFERVPTAHRVSSACTAAAAIPPQRDSPHHTRTLHRGHCTGTWCWAIKQIMQANKKTRERKRERDY